MGHQQSKHWTTLSRVLQNVQQVQTQRSKWMGLPYLHRDYVMGHCWHECRYTGHIPHLHLRRKRAVWFIQGRRPDINKDLLPHCPHHWLSHPVGYQSRTQTWSLLSLDWLFFSFHLIWNASPLKDKTLCNFHRGYLIPKWKPLLPDTKVTHQC